MWSTKIYITQCFISSQFVYFWPCSKNSFKWKHSEQNHVECLWMSQCFERIGWVSESGAGLPDFRPMGDRDKVHKSWLNWYFCNSDAAGAEITLFTLSLMIKLSWSGVTSQAAVKEKQKNTKQYAGENPSLFSSQCWNWLHRTCLENKQIDRQHPVPS